MPNLQLYFKGLSPEFFTSPHTIEESSKLAKGTIYEAWFDTLKTSPWYNHFIDKNSFPSEQSEETFKTFGDLRGMQFSVWWSSVGFKIFAESTPFEDVKPISLEYSLQHTKSANAHPTLRVEIPLNLSPKHLEERLKKLISDHAIYADSYNRWMHSTATTHPFEDNNLDYSNINGLLSIYKRYINSIESNPDLTLAQFTIDENIDSTALRSYKKSKRVININGDLREKLSNVTSDRLKRARYLMANATEGLFPCDEPHDWAKRGTSIIDKY